MVITSTQLLLLVEIRRTGSLARAALQLDVTPPAVSQQLARFEREIGVSLVDRGARGAKLTPLGLSLADHGERVADELRAAEDTAAEFVGAHRNRLRVGAPPSLSVTLLPDVLAAIRYRFREAELSVVDVMSDSGAGLIVDGTLDLALSATYLDAAAVDGVSSRHLLDDEMVVLLPEDHRLSAESGTLDLADLAHDDWVSGPIGRPSRTQLDDAAAQCGFVPTVPFVTESYDVAQSLTDSGVAVALVPRLALNPRLASVVRPLTVPLIRRIAAMMPSSVAHIPLAEVMASALEEVAAGVTGTEVRPGP